MVWDGYLRPTYRRWLRARWIDESYSFNGIEDDIMEPEGTEVLTSTGYTEVHCSGCTWSSARKIDPSEAWRHFDSHKIHCESNG